MESSIQIIIICCNEERRKFQKKQMEDFNLPYAFYDAYTPKTIGDYITEKHKEYPEKDTTICCMRSHIGALKMFVEKFPEKEYVVIAEDDILLINDFKKELEATIQHFKNHKEIDYISLGCSPDQKKKYNSTHTDKNLFWGNMIAWSTTLQIIPMSIAKEMSNLSDAKNTKELYTKVFIQMSKINNGLGYAYKQIRLQSDVLFSILWRQACVWPPMAIENENFNSVITPQDTNNRWQHIFDLNIRKREEFYEPFSMNNVQIIIICCNEERRKFQKKQMEDLNLPYVFYDAYTPKTIGDYITEKNKEHPEADTMICATRSHIGAIDFFVKQYSEKKYCIIVEDDLVFSIDFIKNLDKIIKLWKINQNEIDYVSLGYLIPEKKTKCKNNNGLLYWNLEEALWGQQCYIVGKDAAIEMAKILLQKNTEDLYSVFRKRDKEIVGKLGYAYKQIRIQPDTLIPNLFRQGFVWPPIAVECPDFNSCIVPSFTNQTRYVQNSFSSDNFYKPNNLLNNIPHPYVINLQHRKDRWQETQEECKKLDIIPRRVDAIYNKKDGALGCMASHIKTLTEGLQSNLPIWVCEDDIEILVSKKVLFSIIDEFLKSDGVILCLGNNTSKKDHYNEVFDRGFEIQTTSSYIIKPSFAIILRNHWKEISEYIAEGKTHFSEVLFRQTDMYGKNAYQNIDINWKILQQYFKFLVPKIRCIKQRESYSDIENKVVEYNV